MAARMPRSGGRGEMRKRLLVKKYAVDYAIVDHEGCRCWNYREFYSKEEAEKYLKRLRDMNIEAYLREKIEELELDIIREAEGR